jgi:hypothetical protein
MGSEVVVVSELWIAEFSSCETKTRALHLAPFCYTEPPSLNQWIHKEVCKRAIKFSDRDVPGWRRGLKTEISASTVLTKLSYEIPRKSDCRLSWN